MNTKIIEMRENDMGLYEAVNNYEETTRQTDRIILRVVSSVITVIGMFSIYAYAIFVG